MEVKLWNFNVKSQDLTEPIKLSYMSERILFIFAFTVENRLCQRFRQLLCENVYKKNYHPCERRENKKNKVFRFVKELNS